MSDKLYEAFRIYLMEGLLGVDENNILEVLNNKGYTEGTEKRNQAIDAYLKVIKDPVLKTMIPELSSYDLNNPGTDIKTLYGIRKRELESEATITTTGENNVEQFKTAESVTAPIGTSAIETDINGTQANHTEPEIKPTGTDPLPVEPTVSTIEPTTETTPSVPSTDFVEDIKRVKEMVANTQAAVVEEPTLEPSVRMPVETSQEQLNKEKIKGLRLNQIGYANVVLMSIIVMIIVAIICVFIFA